MTPRHRPHARLHALAALAALVQLTGCAAGASGAARPGPAGAVGDRLSAAVEPVEALGPEDFAPIASTAALGEAGAALERWWGRLFRPEASPARGEGRSLSGRAASGGLPDLVRTEYEMAVMRLDVLDSAGWTLVRVADPGIDVADGAAAQVVVRRLLAPGADRTWTLRLPARLAEGAWYTSNAAADPARLESWRDRIDVRLRGGRLEILCHKREDGPGVPDPAGWFTPEVRARLSGAR